ncbi:MAG: DUF1648 domain-containing protein [Planctomycetota bacterium]|nr:DUF1648 domain-containing protein [Planctomycetota bacterium]
MKRTLYNPLWTQLPAFALIATIIILVARAWPLPERVPVHFNFAGQPNRFGSPWEAIAAFVVVPFLLLILFATFDEVWTRQEKRKRFNWISLIGTAAVAFFTGMAISYLVSIRRTPPNLALQWSLIVPLMAVSMLLAAFLESLRPHYPHPTPVPTPEPIPTDLIQRIRAGSRWAYFESQNPQWVFTSVLVGVALIQAIFAIVCASSGQPWIAVLLAFTSILLLSLSGGMRVLVTPQFLRVRFGFLPIRVLRLKLTDITSAQTLEFSPLADFGGWGIRRNRQMWGYFLRGTRGVKLQTAKGKQYLIGSDHPDRLATILQSALTAPR